MCKLKTLLKMITIASAAFALFACSNSNSGTSSTGAIVLDSSGKHVADWMTTHKDLARSSLAACTECHGSDLTGGISRVSCTSSDPVNGFKCHVTSPAANPNDCISCHGGPTTGGPDGISHPNMKGAHAKHTALAVITGCAACHPNAGTGTANHAKATATGDFSRATPPGVSGAFTAETHTTFGYDPGSDTCSGISCHRGQQTPTWQGPGLELATDCLKCHQLGSAPVSPTAPVTPQYNSFYSGSNSGTPLSLHEFHLTQSIVFTNFGNKFPSCTDCHYIGALADITTHFGEIAANRMTVAGSTVISSPSSTIGSYDKIAKTCSTVSCHNLFPAGATLKWQ